MYDKILVAVDGSENSLRAVEAGVRLARGNRDARLVLLTVIPPVYPFFGYGPLITVQQVQEAVQSAAETVLEKAKEAKEVIDQAAGQAAEIAAEAGVGVESVVQIGDPAQTIIEYAAREGFEVIVMGRRGVGVLKELILGSVSSKVLQLAPCPVLLVR
ncbi:MAG TPA: universal stress protein [Desulfotomaculum sp.]|nr:universal stress protein [Desulfotomaculum sp.]